MNKAIFLDKDGTLIPDIPFNADPSLITLNQYAGEALKEMSSAGYMLVVVSNQSGVAKGYFDIGQLELVSNRINELLKPFEIVISGFFYCPHFSQGTVPEFSFDCNCRKPAPGLILNAARCFDIDLHESWMIGDILHDCEAGKLAGCQTILLDNGNETEWLVNSNRKPDFTVSNLLEAATIICSHEIGHTGYEKGRVTKL